MTPSPSVHQGLPGPIALISSGETTAHAGVLYDRLCNGATAPLQVAILETPAGFQPNSEAVARKVADYLRIRLQNLHPTITLLPARARGSAFSPDDPATTEFLRQAQMIFLGAGSPTYTVRQLTNSLAWQRVLARQRHGTPLITASAATIAMGAFALPVYEIFKVGTDLHWNTGLDLFRPYGLNLVFIPHWDNSEGGSELDTSRCFLGQERFTQMLALLPTDLTVIGIDEHTSLLIDLAAGVATVLGRGGVTLIKPDRREERYERRAQFALDQLGAFHIPDLATGLEPNVWADMAEQPTLVPTVAEEPAALPSEVLNLVAARQEARAARDWSAADQIRGQLADLGWQVRDTPNGPLVERI